MPYFEYQCKNCSYRFDEPKKIEERYEPTQKPCPNCGESGNVEIAISPVIHKWNCELPTAKRNIN